MILLRRRDDLRVLAIPDVSVLSHEQIEELLDAAGLSRLRFVELLDRLDCAS